MSVNIRTVYAQVSAQCVTQRLDWTNIAIVCELDYREDSVGFSNSRLQKALGKYEWIPNGWFNFVFRSFKFKRDLIHFPSEKRTFRYYSIVCCCWEKAVIQINCHLSNVSPQRLWLYPFGKRASKSWCHHCCLVTGFLMLSSLVQSRWFLLII